MRNKHWLIILVLAIAGCKKEDTAYYGINDGSKELFRWKKGSSWLMSDSLTKRVDSFFVVDAESSWTPPSDGRSYEHLKINISEINLTDTGSVVNWHIDIGGGYRKVGYRTTDVQSAAMEFSDYLYSNTPATRTFNKQTFRDVYRSLTYGYSNDSNSYLDLALSGEDAFVYIATSFQGYDHVWMPLRRHIIQ